MDIPESARIELRLALSGDECKDFFVRSSATARKAQPQLTAQEQKDLENDLAYQQNLAMATDQQAAEAEAKQRDMRKLWRAWKTAHEMCRDRVGFPPRPPS
jgi:hypothetical protein